MKDFNWSKYSKPIILVAFIVVLSILRPKAFLSLDNFSNVLWSVAVIGIMVSGSIFVFLIGGIDLSIATLCAFSAVIAVTVTHNMGDTPGAVFAGVFAALIAGALAGAVHGIVITTFKIPAFLVTFATQSIFLGLAMVMTNNKIISCTVPAFTAIGAFKILGFPLPVYFMVVIALVSWYVLRKTVYGRYVYAVGGNPTASEISGINVKKTILLGHVICSVMACLAGVASASKIQNGQPGAMDAYEMYAIASAVLGGTSLVGGSGSVARAMFGVAVIAVIKNGMDKELYPVPTWSLGIFSLGCNPDSAAGSFGLGVKGKGCRRVIKIKGCFKAKYPFTLDSGGQVFFRNIAKRDHHTAFDWPMLLLKARNGAIFLEIALNSLKHFLVY